MSTDHFDCCIIGAGVVGLAIGRRLASAGHSTVVLEQAPLFGSGISSRNSEVIHAGIYYPTGSLKARLCVEGKQRLYQYCAERDIPHRRIGKLIVATSPAQEEQLAALQQQACDNGVNDLSWLDRDQLRALEPEINGSLALLSPATGIIDSHSLMTSLAHELEANGGLLCLNTRFEQARLSATGFDVDVVSVDQPYRFHCDHLVNAAGLAAQQTAEHIEGCPPGDIPRRHLCKGSYFALSGPSPFSHLIYPVPEPNTTGLGIHATLDLSGQTRFGPDTEYIDAEHYGVADQKRQRFADAIQRYYPGLDPDRLTPTYAGIRPKLQGPGDPPQDFMVQHQGNGLINLFGIESPGLTAALAIAEQVSNLISTT